jgi:hypothetical protein
MFEVQAQQSQQMSALLMQLLTQKVDAAAKPAISTEIGELLKALKELRSFAIGGGHDDDEEDGFTSTLGKIGAVFMREVEQQQRAAAVPAPAAGVGPASRPTPTPRPAGPQAVAADASQVQTPQPARQARRATPAPGSPEARINRVARMLIATAEDEDRDAASFAHVIATMLGDDLVEELLKLQPGQLGPLLIQQIPQLTPSAAFIAHVERELREQYAPEKGATDSATDAPATIDPAAGASTST